MKKFVYLSAIVLAIFFAVSCGSTQTVTDEPYMYSGFKNIYPAVHYAMKQWSGGSFKGVPCTVHSLDDVTIEGIQIMEGLRVFAFCLRISNVDNVITYRFSDFISRSITNDTWVRMTGFRQDSTAHSFINHFNTEIPKVLENDDLYYQMLKEVLVSQGSTEAEAVEEAKRVREEEEAYR